MIFRPYYYYETGCAAYLFGCGSPGKCAVVDAHEQDIDEYIAFAEQKGMRITHDALEIYPAHYAGSACGSRMSGTPMTTLAFEKRWKPLLSLNKEQFVEQVSTNIPPQARRDGGHHPF